MKSLDYFHRRWTRVIVSRKQFMAKEALLNTKRDIHSFSTCMVALQVQLKCKICTHHKSTQKKHEIR